MFCHTGLETEAIHLEKVVDFCNDKCSVVERPRSKYGNHRSGLRICHLGLTEDYDQPRSESPKIDTIVGSGNERILHKWFEFVPVDGKLYGRKRSCFDCPSSYDNDFLSCTQTITCGKYEELSLNQYEGSSRSRSFVDRFHQPEGTELRKVLLHTR